MKGTLQTNMEIQVLPALDKAGKLAEVAFSNIHASSLLGNKTLSYW